MLSRTDTITQTQKQQEFFSDFLDSFAMSPYGNQIARVTNNQSINQSLKNIILTQAGERLFQPYVGSFAGNMLFEPFTSGLINLEFLLKNAITNNEPRVEVIDISIQDNENTLNITIVYRPINNIDTQIFNYILKRVR